MSIFQAIIFGLIQGITEFFPISSSGHLAILPYLVKWPDPGLLFTVMLHFGTLAALIICFWRDWIKIFRAAFSPTTEYLGLPKSFLWYIIMATIPGAIVGYFLENYAETTFRAPYIIAGTTIFFGLILFWADRVGQKKRKMMDVTWLDSILIGIAQALAVVPGVSRAGITMTTGLFRGLKREDTARFSFILATPIIFGAWIFTLKDFLGQNGHNELVVSIVGFLVALISGILAIRLLLNWLKKISFTPFVIYRLILGLIILLIYFLRR